MSTQLTLTLNDQLHALLEQKAQKECYGTVQELINAILRRELIAPKKEHKTHPSHKSGKADLIDFISTPRKRGK